MPSPSRPRQYGRNAEPSEPWNCLLYTSYDVTIRETLEVKMKVAANSREEAEQFARDQWKRGEVVLDASHFTGVEFHAKRYSRDRGER